MLWMECASGSVKLESRKQDAVVGGKGRRDNTSDRSSVGASHARAYLLQLLLSSGLLSG